MQKISLQELLEAGCHFGHKSERWHPKAKQYIYAEKDGIHIIDLAKTKTGLETAIEYITQTVAKGGEVLFVGTKRQAQGVLKEEATLAGAPYFSERWIGGFLTNWEQIKKNIEKINRMDAELAAGAWKKFPKHEQSKMARYLNRIKVYYGGVLTVKKVPDAIFVVDVRKEIAAVREAKRCNVALVGVVDTNSDPTMVDYVIPANDDAVGSISYIIKAVAQAYKEGMTLRAKKAESEAAEAAKAKENAEVKTETQSVPNTTPAPAAPSKETETAKSAAGKRGRPKKTESTGK